MPPSSRWIAGICACACAASSLFVGPARADVALPGDVIVAFTRSLVRIEPTSNRRTVLNADIWPWELAFAPDGDLIVADGFGAVQRMDIETGAFTVIHPGGSGVGLATGVVVAPDGMIYITDDRSLYKLDPASGQVSVHFDRIDCEVSCGVARVLGLELSAAGVFYATVTSSVSGAGGVIALDVETQSIRVVSRGNFESYGIVEDAAHQLLVTDLRSPGSVLRIDPVSGARTVVSQGGKLLLPYDIAVSDVGKIYVSELESAGFIVGGSQVVEIDPSTGVQRILARPVSARGIAVVPGTPAPPACRDGLDNDGDRRVDFPRDLGCTTANDGTEQPPCADGFDNDGDGLVDYPEDPGCAGRNPLDQENPQCSDLQDNDGDGLYDHPEDPECLAPHDNTEHWAPRNPRDLAGRDL